MAMADHFSSTESSKSPGPAGPAPYGYSDNGFNGSIPLVLEPDLTFRPLPETPPVAPFPSIFHDIVDAATVPNCYPEDDLGPASPVFPYVSPFASLEPIQMEPALNGLRRFPFEPLKPENPVSPVAPAPPALAVLPQSSIAARQELSALQQVLFDVAMLVTGRQTELADLEARALKAQEIIDESAAGQKELAAWRGELKSVMEKANAEHDQLQASLEEVRSQHQSLSSEVGELNGKRTELEEKIFLLQSTAADLEADIAGKSIKCGSLAHEVASRATSLAELEETLFLQETGKTQALTKMAGELDLAAAALERVKESLFESILKNEALARTCDEQHSKLITLEERRNQLSAETEQMQEALDRSTAAVRAMEERAEQVTGNLSAAEKDSLERETALLLHCGDLELKASQAQTTLAAAERALALVQSTHAGLEQESRGFKALHLSLEKSKVGLQSDLEQLQKSIAEKTPGLARLDRELMQTRRELDELKRSGDRTETELAARRQTFEAELETNNAAHERLQQALAATQARRDALLVKQDEALEELDRRQQNLAALIKEEDAARLAMERTSRELEALTGRLTARTSQTDALVPGSEQHFAALAAVEEKTNAAAALLRKKIAEQEALDEALRHAQSELAAFRQNALSEHQQWGQRREQMEAEFAAATATIDATRKAALHEQTRHQELANRQTTAINEVDGTTAHLDARKA